MTREECIQAIRTALRQRSGKSWSVKGDRGTAYGWIMLDIPPRRRNLPTAQAERQELATLLGFPPDTRLGWDGFSIPASSDYRREYVARAQGKAPDVYGAPYWD